ncbi:unnamed protein product [Arabidopsis halleri]
MFLSITIVFFFLCVSSPKPILHYPFFSINCFSLSYLLPHLNSISQIVLSLISLFLLSLIYHKDVNALQSPLTIVVVMWILPLLFVVMTLSVPK